MPQTLTIGKSPSNNIVFPNPMVSAVHATITYGEDGRIIYTDNSTNGTRINGRFVNRRGVYIQPGDVIVLPGHILLGWNIINSYNPYIPIRHEDKKSNDRGSIDPGYTRVIDNTGSNVIYPPTYTEERTNICGVLSLIFNLVSLPLYVVPVFWTFVIAAQLSGAAFFTGLIGLYFSPRSKAIVGFILSILIPLTAILILEGFFPYLFNEIFYL